VVNNFFRGVWRIEIDGKLGKQLFGMKVIADRLFAVACFE
jgi:hypothetical protein